MQIFDLGKTEKNVFVFLCQEYDHLFVSGIRDICEAIYFGRMVPRIQMNPTLDVPKGGRVTSPNPKIHDEEVYEHI